MFGYALSEATLQSTRQALYAPREPFEQRLESKSHLNNEAERAFRKSPVAFERSRVPNAMLESAATSTLRLFVAAHDTVYGTMSMVNDEIQTRAGGQDGASRRLRRPALPPGPDGGLFPLPQNGSWYAIEPRFAL
jgi:hypothetical protein